MIADAELALEQLGPEGWWRPSAQLATGAANAFLGDVDVPAPRSCSGSRPLLTTHLSSSRAEAIEGAVGLGLLEDPRYPAFDARR